MKTIIKALLPYLVCIGIGGWLVYDNMNTKSELSDLKWNLAVMENRATTAEYSLEQERKYQKEREEFKKELELMFEDFDSQLAGYTKQLQAIKNERNKTGTNNSLSEPVTRVLKDFTNSTNKD